MGYPLDVAARNALLAAWLGDDAAVTMPTSFEVALLNNHPSLGGTELTSDGGYVRAVVANNSTTFPAPSGGMVTTMQIAFADSTDAWSDTAPYGMLIDAADSVTRYLVGKLTQEIVVLGAAPGPVARLSFYWNTSSL